MTADLRALTMVVGLLFAVAAARRASLHRYQYDAYAYDHRELEGYAAILRRTRGLRAL
jgi:hypothetical protein